MQLNLASMKLTSQMVSKTHTNPSFILCLKESSIYLCYILENYSMVVSATQQQLRFPLVGLYN